VPSLRAAAPSDNLLDVVLSAERIDNRAFALVTEKHALDSEVHLGS
jgi:hypothetical protein